MCDCPKEVKERILASSPQTQNAGPPPNRRPKENCCRRRLTYEDEEPNVTITELPISIPEPTPIPGVAIVRRRIDFGTSPDKINKKENEGKTSEDKADEQQQSKDTENEVLEEGKTPQTPQNDAQQQNGNMTTSTPCPGKLNPKNECNCTPIPKT